MNSIQAVVEYGSHSIFEFEHKQHSASESYPRSLQQQFQSLQIMLVHSRHISIWSNIALIMFTSLNSCLSRKANSLLTVCKFALIQKGEMRRY